jgi:membrane-bound lytic murein transglycosylase MltF
MKPCDLQPSSSWPRRSGGPWLRALLLVVALATPVAFAQDTPPAAPPRQLSLEVKPWQGDFEQMLQRRIIRVLIPYSRTLFFNDKGHERGITAENMRDCERYLNQKYAQQLGKRPLTFVLIATTRDKLFTQLNAGLGDIAAGDVTETEERLKLVDFVTPKDSTPVQELLATGPTAPTIQTLDDLAGQTVYVRPSTSYAEGLAALNARLQAAGKAPVQIAPLPDALEDEDKLEMLNAGLLDFVVVDDWLGRMWAQVLPHITVREDLVLRSQTFKGWAIRKGSPQLHAALLDFQGHYLKQQGVLASRLMQYHKGVKQIVNHSGDAEMKRFQDTIALFETYGQKYSFDPLMLTAQGYQESQLRQEAHSRVGAIGVMQVMPATGRALQVGDVHIIEPNIHAGTKYLDQLMTRYFSDAQFSEQNRALFAFAAYNAGPGNIAKMRKEAVTRGFDPNQWFNNVEIVTAARIGMETTTYVRNIYKYYVAYKLIQDAEAAARQAHEQVAPVAK